MVSLYETSLTECDRSLQIETADVKWKHRRKLQENKDRNCTEAENPRLRKDFRSNSTRLPRDTRTPDDIWFLPIKSGSKWFSRVPFLPMVMVIKGHGLM